MNTQLFKYAAEVARTGSITQAADNLYMAQPNLSKAIKELEDTLGITIFKRTPKGVVTTPKGAEFLSYAKNVLLQIDQIESLYLPESSDRQQFSISIPRVSYIATAVTRFVSTLDYMQEIDVNVQETNAMQTISNIEEGKFDLGVIRYKLAYENYFMDFLAQKEIKYEPIWEFEYLAVMNKDHPLAQRDEVLYNELKDYTQIAHGDLSVPYLPPSEFKRQDFSQCVNKRIYVYERCSQFDLLTHVPSTYMWVSPIPQELLDRYGLVQRVCKLENNRQRDLLIYPQGYALGKLDRRFMDKLYEVKNEIAFTEYR
ncbi:MAG: LysR family transcriptional regulator [Clostridia bacterium]